MNQPQFRSILASCVCAAAVSSTAQAANTTQLKRLSCANLRLYYTAQGPSGLLYNGATLIKRMYFYTSVKSETGKMIEGFNFRRNEDGHRTFQKEKIDAGYRLTWYNKRYIYTRPTRRTDRLAGEATVTLTIAENELSIRHQAKIEPNLGFGEIGFFVSEDMLTRGEEGAYVAGLPNGTMREGKLPRPPSAKWNIVQGMNALTFESPRETYELTFTGSSFNGSHGLHFQDFRKRDQSRGCYRIVLSMNTTKGNELDYTWRMRIRPHQAEAAVAEERPDGSSGATEEVVLRPDVEATVHEVGDSPRRTVPSAAAPLRAIVTDSGQISLSEGDQILVERDYFGVFAAGKPKRDERKDGDIHRILVQYDAPRGTLRKETVVSPDEAWIMWTVKAKEEVRGEAGFYCPESAFKPPFITYRSVNQSGVQEHDDLELSSSYCIVSGGKDNPREFQCGTSRRPDWIFQDFRARGNKFRFVAVPRLSPGQEWRAIFRYVRRSDEPYPAMSLDGGREERGILSTLLPDAMADGFTIVPVRSAKYAFTDEPLAIRMKYYALDYEKREVQIRWRLIDMWGQQVKEGSLALTNEGRRFAAESFGLSANANGAYRMEIDYTCGEVARTRELVFTVMSDIPNTGFRPGSVFGAALGSGDYLGTLAKRIGLKWNRCHCAIGDTQCGYVVPERGQYAWDRIEKAIDFHGKYQIYGCHSISEGWKAKWIRDLWKAGDFDEYLKAFVDEYVKALARQFKGKITCWEVTNEPYYQFKNCPEKWVQLMKTTYEALKEIDPKCTVVGTCGPPGSMGYSWYRRTFALGSLKYQDAVSSHLYHFGPWVGSRVALTVRSWMQEIRKIMKKHGRVVPLWNSETTVTPPSSMYRHPSHTRYVRYHPGESPTDPLEQAQTYFKVLVMHKIEDVKYSFHIFHGGVEYTSHTGEYDETPLGFLATQAALSKYLETAEYLGDVNLHNELFACLLRDDKRLILIPWGPMFLKRDRADVTVPVPASRFTARDVFGNPLPVQGDDKETRLTVSWQGFYLLADDMSVDALKTGLSKAKVTLRFADEGDRTVKGRFGEEAAGPPKRPNWIGFHAVDLTPVANRGFQDEEVADGKGGWADEGSNDMRFLPTGDWLINGVPFRIVDPAKNNDKACVVLKGGMQPDPPVPAKVTVSVGKRLSKLHFLHTVTWGSRRPSKAFAYVLHYRDGFKEEVQIHDRVHLANWWFLGKVPEAKVGWEGPNPVRAKVRLWHATHEITHPKGAQAVMDHIEIVSECKRPVPIVVAITGVYSN